MTSTSANTISPPSPQRAFFGAILRAPQRYFGWTWFIVLGLCITPFAVLVWEYATQQLGVNPFERLSRFTGTWALNLLLITLAITPVRRHAVKLMRLLRTLYGRRLSDWNWLVKLRRMLGVSAFCYALLHAMIYLGLDVGFDIATLTREVLEKPYLAAGAIALTLLVPLAATSTDGMMRRLGRNWRRLHRLVYPAAIIAAVHYIWLVKVGVGTPYIYAAVLAALLLDRVVVAFSLRPAPGRPLDDGMEVPEREGGRGGR